MGRANSKVHWASGRYWLACALLSPTKALGTSCSWAQESAILHLAIDVTSGLVLATGFLEAEQKNIFKEDLSLKISYLLF